MYEEVITGLMLELVMTLTDHIDCIVDKIKIILDLNLMEWNSKILKKKKNRTVGGQQCKKKGMRCCSFGQRKPEG